MSQFGAKLFSVVSSADHTAVQKGPSLSSGSTETSFPPTSRTGFTTQLSSLQPERPKSTERPAGQAASTFQPRLLGATSKSSNEPSISIKSGAHANSSPPIFNLEANATPEVHDVERTNPVQPNQKSATHPNTATEGANNKMDIVPQAPSQRLASLKQATSSLLIAAQPTPVSSSSSVSAFQSRPSSRVPASERALVSTSASSINMLSAYSSGGSGSDPFAEISRTVHAQSRRIRELESAQKDSEDMARGLRERVNELQEQSKVASQDTALARGEVARMEALTKHKDEELIRIHQRVHDLETERTRMAAENTALVQSIEQHKRRFVEELKQASQHILILSKVVPDRPIPILIKPESTSSHESAPAVASFTEKLTVAEKAPMDNQHMTEAQTQGELSSMTENQLAALEHRCAVLQREYEISVYWLNILLDLLAECDSCTTKYESLRPDLEGKQPPRLEDDAGETTKPVVRESEAPEAKAIVSEVVVVDIEDIREEQKCE